MDTSTQSHSTLPTGGDIVDLVAAICDVGSVSGNERALADAVHAALSGAAHLTVDRDGDAIVARTHLGRPTRVVIGGHLDTVPLGVREDGEPNFPTWRTGSGDDEIVHGRGTCDMLGGVAVQLAAALRLTQPIHDVTWVFYDHEEVDASLNGLGRLMRNHPDWLACDFAILCEPTNARVEGGCNGTIRVAFTAEGVSAHSARAWKGENAIHKLAPLLSTLASHDAGEREVDGLVYRQSLSAVGISGGIAGNVVPDSAQVLVNYRFAPDRTPEQAARYVIDLLGAGLRADVVDSSPGARPGLDHPVVAEFVALTGAPAVAKVGWTDVSRFSALGVPAVNFGPGDPLFAHKDDEHVRASDVRAAHKLLVDWLSTPIAN